MKKPVWHSESKGSARETFVAFSAGRDVVATPAADEALVPYDIWTNQAHAMGLHRSGVYSQNQLQRVLKALRRLEDMHHKGKWSLDPSLEDVHINIESYLTDQCGDAIGGRLHSGRSRNDQVATDMKLWMRDVTLAVLDELVQLHSSLCSCSKEHADSVMPGYTHHRKATVTSWGHWCSSYAQGILRDIEKLQQCFSRMNTCPLGAAASYGTTWKPDRELVALLLGFDAVQENTLDCVTSRGEAEAELVQALAMMLKRLSQLSQDLILFSTDEFGFLNLPGEFTTGSSIMPQKRNPDFAEAIKGKTHVVIGCAISLLTMNSGNMAGYNKDVQWSKYQAMDAVRESTGAASILAEVMAGLSVNTNAMLHAASSGFLNAVDIADYLAQDRGIPFRNTYRVLSEAVGISTENTFTKEDINAVLASMKIRPLSTIEFHALHNPVRCLKQRDHSGSPNPQRVRKHALRMMKDNASFKKWIGKKRSHLNSARDHCRKGTLPS